MLSVSITSLEHKGGREVSDCYDASQSQIASFGMETGQGIRSEFIG